MQSCARAASTAPHAATYARRMVKLGYDCDDFVLSLSAAQLRGLETECQLTTADTIKIERLVAAETLASRRAAAAAGPGGDGSGANGLLQNSLQALRRCVACVETTAVALPCKLGTCMAQTTAR